MEREVDKLLQAIGGPGRLLIVPHDNPDPDAAGKRLCPGPAGSRYG